MKKMKMLCVVAISALLSFNTWAADLFVDEKIRAIQPGDPITATDTLGGYAIYQGESEWKFEKSAATMSQTFRSSSLPVPMGSVQMAQWVNGTLFMNQFVKATLSQSSYSWVGTPCAPGHLVAVNKPRGKEDHCMTIDPEMFTAGNKNITMLSIRLTNSMKGRFYFVDLRINPEFLGIKETGPGDWAPEVVQSQPYKKAFIEKLTVWAENLLERSVRAFDYAQPQNAYADMPSIRALLPVSAAYPSSKFSLGFLSALEDIKHRKDFKAIAYSSQTDSRTVYGNAWGLTTQADADKKVLDSCEQRRSQSTLPCKLVDLTGL